MDRVENGTYTTNGSPTEAHESFPTHYGLWKKKMFKAYFSIFVLH